MVHVFPGPAMCRLKWKWGTRGDEDKLSSHAALCLCRVGSQAQLDLKVGSGAEICSRRHLTMVMVNSKWGYFRFGSLWVPHLFEFLDHFPVDPVIAPISATGHQLVTLCHSICAEKRAQTLDPLIGSRCLTTCFCNFPLFTFFPVHRIRCCSPAFGAWFCTFESTCCWQKWHQCRWVRSKSSPSLCAVKAHI